MQIIFNEAEKAEIDRLVASYSPSNHPLVGPTLGLLKQDVRDRFVEEYEDMLRAVAGGAYTLLPLLEDDVDELDDLGVSGLQDVLNSLTNRCMLGRSEETLRMLAGQGDSQLSEACYRLSLDLISEILATRPTRVAVAS